MVRRRHLDQPHVLPTYLGPLIQGELYFDATLLTAGQVVSLDEGASAASLKPEETPAVSAPTTETAAA